LAQRLPVTARPALGAVDVTREAVVGLFAGFGCKDHRVVVRTIVRKAGVLVVSLVERPLEPGRAECQAIFATWRLLTVTRSQLARPLPTRVEVRFARA
jgi:hypothetical protein